MYYTESLSHTDFVKGYENGSYGVVALGQSERLLPKHMGNAFTGLIMLYLFGPLVVIPILSYSNGNWWLLFGILACYIGCFSATGFRSIMGVATLGCIVFWLCAGLHLHQYVTFFYLCALAGYFLYEFADNLRSEEVKRAVLRDTEMYEAAMAGKLITVLKMKPTT